jgi:hypothetical protein
MFSFPDYFRPHATVCFNAVSFLKFDIVFTVLNSRIFCKQELSAGGAHVACGPEVGFCGLFEHFFTSQKTRQCLTLLLKRGDSWQEKLAESA